MLLRFSAPLGSMLSRFDIVWTFFFAACVGGSISAVRDHDRYDEDTEAEAGFVENTTREEDVETRRIWDGDDVKCYTFPTRRSSGAERSWELTPFPAFVSLIFLKKADPKHRARCGGTLYRKKFIITNAHCVVGRDPTMWYLHALLNPYRNPQVAEEAVATLPGLHKSLVHWAKHKKYK